MPAQKAVRQAHRARADDRDVADLVEVAREVDGIAGHDSRASSVRTSPSSALTIRSKEAAMQVKLGVSRRV